MTRRTLWAALVGVVGLKGQEATIRDMAGHECNSNRVGDIERIFSNPPTSRVCTREGWHKVSDYHNGQCPVCGWQAEAWKPERVATGFLGNCKPTGDGFTLECEPAYLESPPERRIDCENCGNTYRQKAEAHDG